MIENGRRSVCSKNPFILNFVAKFQNFIDELSDMLFECDHLIQNFLQLKRNTKNKMGKVYIKISLIVCNSRKQKYCLPVCYFFFACLTTSPLFPILSTSFSFVQIETNVYI